MFDINALTQTPVTGKLDTEIPLYPDGEYIVQVEADEKAINWKHGIAKDQEGKERPWVNMMLKCRIVKAIDEGINLEEVAKERGRTIDELFFMHGIMLDTTGNALDMGPAKNIRLGQLREAVGQNDAELAWHFDMLKGQTFKLRVNTKPDKDGVLRNNVTMVAAADL